MKKNTFLLVILLVVIAVTPIIAQKENVGIGTTKPDQSAALDISSSNKGLLMPRMSLQQRGGIQNPAQGLVIYQTDFLSGFYFYDGKEWKPMTSEMSSNSVADASNWGLTGNAGTAASTNFIGTTDANSLIFKVNNILSGKIDQTSNENTFFGYSSGSSMSSGTQNVGLGNNALKVNTTGSYNSALGTSSLILNTSGILNTAVGVNTLSSNTTGGYNTAIGGNALLSNSTGSNNTAIGTEALNFNTTGTYNVGIGNSTLFSNTTGFNNTALGTLSLQYNTTGYYNSGFGVAALRYNTTGFNNMGIGQSSLLSNTTGSNNVGIGVYSLNTNTVGSDNMGIGFGSLYSNIIGEKNVAIGTSALTSSIGSNNIGLGFNAGYSTTGSGSIFLGFQAGYSETSGNKLYIANSNTTTPLVYGDFSTKYLAVGEVAAADRAAATTGGYRLLVKGGMITEKIKVATAGSADWADYVFEDDYKKMTLEEVEAFVKENKHLPNVPTTQEVIFNGNDLGKTDAKLLEKIEELTLYMIEMNKEIKALQKENEQLRKK